MAFAQNQCASLSRRVQQICHQQLREGLRKMLRTNAEVYDAGHNTKSCTFHAELQTATSSQRLKGGL
jgi:hypothetical protein